LTPVDPEAAQALCSFGVLRGLFLPVPATDRKTFGELRSLSKRRLPSTARAASPNPLSDR